MNKYLIHFYEYCTIEIEAENKKEAEDKYRRIDYDESKVDRESDAWSELEIEKLKE